MPICKAMLDHGKEGKKCDAALGTEREKKIVKAYKGRGKDGEQRVGSERCPVN